MTALVDTGVLLAVLAQNDHLHDVCALALQEASDPLLPSVVLPELAYMVVRDMGYPTFLRFLRAVLDGELPIVYVTEPDLERALETMEDYADSRVDFVDCVIVALAERLDVTHILTVDRRHFTLFRPKHCPAFDLAP